MIRTYILDVDFLRDERVYSRMLSTVSEQRREKAERCRTVGDRLLSLGAGIVLNIALTPYGITERDANFKFGAHGKPYIDGREDLFFSLSHSKDKVVCAVSKREVGADIERIRDISDGLLKRVCTDKEKKYLDCFDKARQTEEFFRLWTAKESFMKFLGQGLGAMRSFEVLLGKGVTVKQDLCKDEVYFKEYSADGYKITVCGEENEFCEELIKAEND